LRAGRVGAGCRLGATEIYNLGGASIMKPICWTVSRYRGAIATVVAPIAFLSRAPFTRVCADANADADKCTTPGWFPPDTRTPAAGVLVLWLAATFPSNAGWHALPGQRTLIYHHRARVYSGPPIDACPDGTATEVEANVLIATHGYGPPKHRSYPGSRLAMTACLGPKVSSRDCTAVTTMLHSLHIKTHYWF
jgi:hypothetical protein